jgi:PAS domain S-box-containing protein
MSNDGKDGGSLSPSAASVPLGDAAFLHAVLEAIPAFVLRLDPDQRIRYINHLRGGLTLDQVIGRPARDLVAPEDHRHYDEAVSCALRTGEPCSYAARGTRAVTEDGAAHYECHIVPIDNGDGRRALCLVATDVSAHVKRANALAQSEEKLRIAVDATGIGLWTWNLQTDQIEWNQRLRDITGCDPMSTAEYIARIVHPEDRSRLLEEVTAARAAKPKFIEYRIIRPDGEIRWLLPCGRVTKVEGGGAVHMIGGMLDITAQRKTAEHLLLAQKLDVVGGLTTGIAHNFNNMLAIIQPALELALERPEADHAELLRDALHATNRAAELVGQLMTFAGQRRPAAAARIDLIQLVERTVSMCRRTFESRVEFEWVCRVSSADVCGDAMSIEQVLVNLLINARDALGEVERIDPCIRVELAEASATHPDTQSATPASYLRIRVEDNGAGMSDAVMQRVFEPFFTTKKPGKGTGLGLATSYAVVRDLGGFIVLESQPAKGTTVSVFLPPSAAPNASQRTSAPEPSPVQPGTILVIDDEPAVRRVIELILRDRGHRVHAAGDGQAAVAQLDLGLCPDLILLDRSMPGWPVKHTLLELRKRAPRVPILCFTGQEVTSDERSQVEEVLNKPLAHGELVNAVERWLGPQRYLART